jgi:hypothetical protein
LKAGEYVTATLSSQSLLVKPEVAQRQRNADAAAIAAATATQTPQHEGSGTVADDNEQCTDAITSLGAGTNATVMPAHSPTPKRFYSSVKLDALRLRRDVGQIADEVVQHFASLLGAEVEINLEIQVRIPNGIPDNVVRTVRENCRVLKFTHQEFEEF